jgi:hypothetical protein
VGVANHGAGGSIGNMSSVAKIEAAIQKLGVAEQRILARHLGERLAEAENPVGPSAPDEGIRFLVPYDVGPLPRASLDRKRRREP